MKILIVEDQEKLAKLIQKGLILEGFSADYVLDGEEAANRIAVHHSEYDLIILDYMLPNKSGLEICSQTRERKIAIPILMLTGKDALPDITAGLNSGADDYLTKPFSFDELVARIRAILRRPKITLPSTLQIKHVQLDPLAKIVTCNKKLVSLTLREFSLLEYLMRHGDEALSRETILSGVWDFAFDSFANVVDVHIANLRKKLGDLDGKIIETVRGIGYKMNTK